MEPVCSIRRSSEQPAASADDQRSGVAVDGGSVCVLWCVCDTHEQPVCGVCVLFVKAAVNSRIHSTAFEKGTTPKRCRKLTRSRLALPWIGHRNAQLAERATVAKSWQQLQQGLAFLDLYKRCSEAHVYVVAIEVKSNGSIETNHQSS